MRNIFRLAWGELIRNRQKEKPVIKKPSKLPLIISSVMWITFVVFLIIIIIHSCRWYPIENIEFFYDGFMFILSFFVGYIVGDNSNK